MQGEDPSVPPAPHGLFDLEGRVENADWLCHSYIALPFLFLPIFTLTSKEAELYSFSNFVYYPQLEVRFTLQPDTYIHTHSEILSTFTSCYVLGFLTLL